MSRRVVVAVLGVLAGAIMPSVSQAQFSKLKKAATSAATGAAGVPTSPPRYVENLDLTSAQLAQVNTGLAAEVAAAPQAVKDAEAQQKNSEKAKEQYEKARADYEQRRDKYNACRDKLTQEAAPQREALGKKAGAAGESAAIGESEEAQMEAQAKAAQAAAERMGAGKGTPADQQTLDNFQKTMAGFTSRGTSAITANKEVEAFDEALVAKIEKTCGATPVAPTAPGSAANTAAEAIQKAGATASGMTLATWIVTREKAIGYAQSNTQVKAGKIPEAEADAINSALGVTRERVAAMQKAGVPM